MTEEEEGQIQDHLTICEDCARLLLSLSEFEQYRPELDAAAGEDPSAAAWLRFRDRLREEEAAEVSAQEEDARTSVVQPLQRRKVPVWEKAGVAWAVAAVLALCVVGLGIRDMTPPAPPAERSEPRFGGSGNVISLELEGDEVQRGGGEEQAPELINPSARLLEYAIRLPGDDPDAMYEVEILDAGEEPVWKGQNKASDGYLEIEFGRSYLSAGAYRFRVHQIEGNERALLGTTESFNVP